LKTCKWSLRKIKYTFADTDKTKEIVFSPEEVKKLMKEM
jgi:hypothetical protein